MKKLKTFFLLCFFLMALFLNGCAYSGVAMNASGNKIVVIQNDLFLLGALRKVIVCEVVAGDLQCISKTP